MLQTKERRVARILDACYDDPCAFNDAVLGRKPYWRRQIEMCDLIVNHDDTIIVSGNAVGKSFLLAGIGLWYLATRRNSVVICTAPTANQLNNVLFRAIRAAWSNSLLPFGGTVTKPGAIPQYLRLSDDHFMIGMSTTKVEKISGIRSSQGHTLCLVDEASGVSEQIFDGLDSIGYDKMVCIGNPLRPSGRFYEDAQKAAKPGSGIGYIRISSLESPHANVEKSDCGFASQSWLRRMAQKYGEDSMWWKSHILAEFPESGNEVLIPVRYLESLATTHTPHGPKRLSVDLSIGTGRDYSAIVVRDDNGIYEIAASSHWDFGMTADKVAALAKQYNVTPSRIYYDAGGIGVDFDNRLRAVGIKGAIGYRGNGKGGVTGTNLRAAAGWAMRRRLDPSRAGQTPFYISQSHLQQYLRAELLSYRYENSDDDKVALENKDEMVARLGKSPDIADALLISFAFP